MRIVYRRVLVSVVVAIVGGAAWASLAMGHDPEPKAAQQTIDGQDKAHDAHKHGNGHSHATVPTAYRGVSPPASLWTDTTALARGQTIYAARCAVCHGANGAGDGPAATALPVKPASFADKAMVSSMTPAYWFWRVTEGATVEPFRSAGSAMPAWKNELSVDDRWAVIAYQHSLSGHRGRHDAAEHPELRAAEGRPHPEPRGVAFTGAWVTRDHRAQPRGPWRYAIQKALPQLYREFNGIDFGHAHLGETLLKTQDAERVERSRLQVLDFIFSSPRVPPDEEQIAPTFSRLAPEVEPLRSFRQRRRRQGVGVPKTAGRLPGETGSDHAASARPSRGALELSRVEVFS